MRATGVTAPFSGFRDPSLAAAALVFLHELSAQQTIGQPPREAHWQRILDRPERDWGAALDQGCRACAQMWPEQLEGFFASVQRPRRARRRPVRRRRHHRRRVLANPTDLNPHAIRFTAARLLAEPAWPAKRQPSLLCD